MVVHRLVFGSCSSFVECEFNSAAVRNARTRTAAAEAQSAGAEAGAAAEEDEEEAADAAADAAAEPRCAISAEP